MKKILSVLLTSAALLPVSINTVNANAFSSGFYVGANFGGGMGSGKYSINYTPAGQGSDSGDLGLKGIRGGLHFGYDYLATKVFLLGLEVSGDFSNTKGEQTRADAAAPVNTQTLSAKRKDAFALALRIGGIVHQSYLGYLKVGIETAKWETSLTSGPAAVTAYTTKSSDSKKERLTGLVLGLGAETMLTKNVSAGLEWTYTLYKSSKSLQLTGPANATATATVKPHTNDFRLRIGYKF
jgi:opacity protein-like surface antigen